MLIAAMKSILFFQISLFGKCKCSDGIEKVHIEHEHWSSGPWITHSESQR
jgi:hypothetical protein